MHIMKKSRYTHRPFLGGLHGWVVPNQMHGVTEWSWRVKDVSRLPYY